VGGVRRFEPSLACAGRVSRPTTVRLAVSLILISGLAAALTACGSGNGEKLGERVVPFGQPVPKGGGVYRIGSAYQVDGVWYQPKEDPAYDRVGTASWYGELFHGRRTANGEIYDMDRLSAAHPTLPLPVYARVTNLQNGRSIIVRINDRGPYANDRIIDLSRHSAELLGYRDKGTAQVRVQFLARAPLNGDDSYERRYLANHLSLVVENAPDEITRDHARRERRDVDRRDEAGRVRPGELKGVVERDADHARNGLRRNDDGRHQPSNQVGDHVLSLPFRRSTSRAALTDQGVHRAIADQA